MDRNKITQSLFHYWRSKMCDGVLPSRADISPHEIRTLLPFLFLADVKPCGEIVLRLVGTHIEQTLGCDLTGCALRTCNHRWADFAVQKDLFDCADNGSVIAVTHELRAPSLSVQSPLVAPIQPILSYDRIVLPLSADGIRIDMLLGAMVTEYREAASAFVRGPMDLTEIDRFCLSAPYTWPATPAEPLVCATNMGASRL